jgi:hypothetical protein
MTDLLDRLRGGDRRSIGRSEEVVADVLRAPVLFGELVAGLLDDDPVLRMRCADAVEKATRYRPEWLPPYKTQILYEVAASEQQEIRWHVAQMMPRLDLEEADVPHARAILTGYLADASRIVQVEAMQALVYLAEISPPLREEVTSVIAGMVTSGGPAVRSRGRKLLERLTALSAGD